jgi:hypothetical protein
MQLPPEGICQRVTFREVLCGVVVVVNQSWHRSPLRVQLIDFQPLRRGLRAGDAEALATEILEDVDRLWLWVPNASCFLYSWGADQVCGDLFISTERRLSEALCDAGVGFRGNERLGT